MRVLGIETSGTIGSVALIEAGGALGTPKPPGGEGGSGPDPVAGAPPSHVLFDRSFTAGLIHGRELAPAVKAALDDTGTRLEDVGLIAVSKGPGSYTGLRVGIAFAKALAWAARRPLVGVVSFAAMVENVPEGAIATPVLDARWGQVYGAVYERGTTTPNPTPSELKSKSTVNCAWREVVPPEATAPEAFAARIPDGAIVFGDGLKRYAGALLRPGLIEGDPAWAIPQASAVARLGAALFAAGAPDETQPLVPLYLRPTEAEVNAGVKSR